ncbi:response regulator [Lysobacter humi (ex Lee et al. 2017)]
MLLVEDDPVSASFLQAALERLPARVDIASSCTRARGLTRTGTYGLLVFDANLPDGRGDALLGELRGAGVEAPAIAHTASRDGAEHERLLAAGFLEVLTKPLSTSEVLSAARHALDLPPPPIEATPGVVDSPLWDDASALRALVGDRSHLDALRRLFVVDLRAMRAAVANAVRSGDAAVLQSILHRLRASCGFVGAPRLAQAARTMSEGDARAEWPAFDAVAGETLEQLPVSDPD